MLPPTRFNANVARHIVHKMQRWALRLAEFNFTVEHIPGELNTWADFLTRWAASGNAEFPARRISAFRVPLITEDPPEPPIAGSYRQIPDLSHVPLPTPATPARRPRLRIWMDKAANFSFPTMIRLQLRIVLLHTAVSEVTED